MPRESVLTTVERNQIRIEKLMGRDNAYLGIYSQTVIDHWKKTLGVLEYTENAPHYLALNWKDDTVMMV